MCKVREHSVTRAGIRGASGWNNFTVAGVCLLTLQVLNIMEVVEHRVLTLPFSHKYCCVSQQYFCLSSLSEWLLLCIDVFKFTGLFSALPPHIHQLTSGLSAHL